MKHLIGEELIEHYYGEDRDSISAARHLAECSECTENYAALQADLTDLRDLNPPPRDPAYGQRVWESIAHSLPERPDRRPLWTRPALWRGLAYSAACAMLAACMFCAGRLWEHTRIPVTTAVKTPPPAPQRVVVVVLGDHLDRSERLLVELKHADADDSEMLSPLRDEARNLLPANRICQREAEDSDDPELEKALRALDRVLTGLANQPEDLDSAALMRLQKQMNADGLLFEVRVLRSRIPAAGQKIGTASEGGKI